MAERAAKKTGPDASKLSEESLREAALSYLDRYDASLAQLRQVLRRRVAKYGSEETAELAQQRIETLLERFQSSALLDDKRFARGFAAAARLRGGSSQKIRQKLQARGIDHELVDGTLRELASSDGLDDLGAAVAYVQKKRLKARVASGDPKERERALASLARQGFSFDVAKKALEVD